MSDTESHLASYSDPLVIGKQSFKPGKKGGVVLTVGSHLDYQPVDMCVHVRRGRKPGPTLLLTAGIHGDELTGVEILRRLLKSRRLQSLRGSLLVIPVVCMPAFLNRSRYLPDRRDLNRLFPGSTEGSLGGRLASTFIDEVVNQSDYAIDYHAGATGRPNLPQIRVTGSEADSMALAKAFKPPVIIETALREGSLRYQFGRLGIPSLLYEAGEAGRLDSASIRYGLRGTFNVLEHLEMLPPPRRKSEPKSKTVVATGTQWLRAPQGGLFSNNVDLGQAVGPDTKLGVVGDPLGRRETPLTTETDGVVIGFNRHATVDEGDALFHIATTNNPEKAEAHIQRSEEIMEEHTAPLH